MSLSERLNAAAKVQRGDAPRPAEHVGGERADAIDVGIPVPCPHCGGRGFLDLIDVRRRLQHEHCVECRASWHRTV